MLSAVTPPTSTVGLGVHEGIRDEFRAHPVDRFGGALAVGIANERDGDERNLAGRRHLAQRGAEVGIGGE